MGPMELNLPPEAAGGTHLDHRRTGRYLILKNLLA